MQRKIYVAGMFDDESAGKVDGAVRGVAGVTSCTANASKAQVLVEYDESTAGIEDAINNAIKSQGIEVLS
jgi:copper chaperone